MENKNQPNNNSFFNKNPILMFAIFAVVMVLIFRSMSPDEMGISGANSKNISYSELKSLIKSKQINEVVIGQTTIKASGNGQAYVVKKVANDQTLVPLLEENNISYGAYSESNWLSDMLFSWVIPVFIFFAIWMFLASRMQKNMGSGILGMGSSKKLINSEKPKVKFDDVAGVEEAKEEVKEIVDFLKNPERYIIGEPIDVEFTPDKKTRVKFKLFRSNAIAQEIIGKLKDKAKLEAEKHSQIVESINIYTTMNEAITTLSKKKTQLLLLEMDYMFPNNRDNIRRDCNKRSGLVLRA